MRAYYSRLTTDLLLRRPILPCCMDQDFAPLARSPLPAPRCASDCDVRVLSCFLRDLLAGRIQAKQDDSRLDARRNVHS